ncbi:ATP-binding protein [Patescibacteria group bacterium]|nr:ATP-binding protein [Patescibacteria group bacterium]
MGTKFVNRKIELKWLEESYKKVPQESQLLVIYGKRRVGKTELVKHFNQSKPYVYFVAEKGTAQDQLQSAKNVFADALQDNVLKMLPFQSWREFFGYLGAKLRDRKEPIVLVFDEFPYLVESNAGIPSYFQVGWDEYLKNTKTMMILMGSSIAMMYKHALVYSSPLYGRRTGQWLLEPFNFKETKNFYPNAPFENTFPLYAISGGIPAYAKVFNGMKTLKQNIIDYVLQPGAFLSVEPELLVSDEFTDPRSFLTILKAIGLGRTKFSEIIQETGLPSTALPGYLKTLINLRLVKKEIPITEKIPEKSKKGNYSLSDSFLRFYFSFIYPNNSLIKSGNLDALFTQHGETLVSLVSKSYEDITGELIQETINRRMLPQFEQMGRWWDKNTEIDLVGMNKGENAILFVETKWNTKPIDIDVLENLKKRSKAVEWGGKGRKEYFALVAKGGFTKKLIEQAKKEDVVLIHKDRVVK